MKIVCWLTLMRMLYPVAWPSSSSTAKKQAAEATGFRRKRVSRLAISSRVDSSSSISGRLVSLLNTQTLTGRPVSDIVASNGEKFEFVYVVYFASIFFINFNKNDILSFSFPSAEGYNPAF
jgi:hypothetical protein